jgi:hypothetical protein
MKKFILALSVFFAFSAVHAANLCDQNKNEIGTQIKLSLALDNNDVRQRQFLVTECKNNIFTAYDKSQNSTIIQYKAGQGDIRKIRFVGVSKDPSQLQPVLNGLWNIKTSEVKISEKEKCPQGQHWDAPMNMCMPNECPAGQYWDVPMNMCMPNKCPQGQHWDEPMKMCMPDKCSASEHWDDSMSMCMPGADDNKAMVMFHYNQFMVYTGGSGPRGRDAFSAPNMWMLMFSKKISERNTVGMDWMGTTDLWTVPKNGTPELFQTGEANKDGVPYVDAQHPHSSPIMGLTFYDILSFGANGEKKLTFFFAPRGEATAGPQAFMHRTTGIVNPDVPLAHHLQDVFHVTSTVVGMKLEVGKLTLEGSTFSGQEPSPAEVHLDMHKPDSWAFRANYSINDNISVGASTAKVKALDRVNNPTFETEDERAHSAWVTTSNMIKNGTLSTATIWGQNDNKTDDVKLNSFLEEFVYELGKNNFYGRLEVLQRTPEQLELSITDPSGARWIKAITLGYERQIKERGNMKVYMGAAVTKYAVPSDFQSAYGSEPYAAKVYLRVNFDSMQMHHH